MKPAHGVSIRNLYESHVKDAGGDSNPNSGREGGRKLGNQIKSLVEAKKLDPHEINIQDMVEAMIYPQLDEGRVTHMTGSDEIAEAASASGFPYATSQAIMPVAIAGYEANIGQAVQLVREVKSTRKVEQMVGATALAEPNEIKELEPYEETIPGEKRWQITNRKVGNIVSLSKEAILMDQANMIVDKASRIGENLGTLRQKWIVQKAADIACWDGTAVNTNHVYNGSAVAIYANDHSSTIDLQTNDNIDGTNVFGTIGLATCNALLDRMVDEEGNAISIVATTLLVPPELTVAAWKAINSPSNYDDANDSANPYKGRYTVLSSPFLTSSVQYYLGNPRKQFVWTWIWKPMVEKQGTNSEKAFSNDIIARWKVSMYGGMGSTDYRFFIRGGV